MFAADDDRERYLGRLGRNSEHYGIRIHAYYLMSNNVHLIAKPLQENSLALAIGHAHAEYASGSILATV